MKFENLKEKCEYYRSLTDYKVLPNSNLIILLDGHSFSKKVKNAFKRPFDEVFIDAMNKTAQYLCETIQGAKIAYVQSDEISILITDYDTPMTDSYFGYRLCKIQSIAAGMASAYFTKLMIGNIIREKVAEADRSRKDNYGKFMQEMSMFDFKCKGVMLPNDINAQTWALHYGITSDGEGRKEIDFGKIVDNAPLYDFDCKAWVVPNENDAYAWFLYRQIDCVRNSRQQAAQAYLPHKKLMGLSAEKQVELLKAETGIEWKTAYEQGKRYGRFIYKENEHMSKILPNGEEVAFVRNTWQTHDADDLTKCTVSDFFEYFRNNENKK